MTWCISIPEIERYKTVPVWRNHERWCELSNDPQDTSCTHVSWHIRRWYLTWVQTPRWWSGLILSLAWFLIFPSWCKYSVFLSKKVSTSPVNVSTSYVLGVYFLASRHPFLTICSLQWCVFLVFIEKWLILLFILCGYIFSHFLPPFGRSTTFL